MLYVFSIMVKMNTAAMVAAVIILLIKYILRRLGAPRRALMWLWLLIAVRLTVPSLPSSKVSVFNLAPDEARTAIKIEMHSLQHETYDKSDVFDIRTAAALVWMLGAAVMLGSGAVSAIRLKRRLKFAVCDDDGIYWTDSIDTPFVFGLLKPRIYFPEYIRKQDHTLIAEHERVHVRRKDNALKLFAYVLLSVNWINPINWWLFRMLSDDIELACDEEVLAKNGAENKGKYTEALLYSVTHGKELFGRYVGFSFNTVSRRIKNILDYKQPRRRLSIAVGTVCAVMLILLGTNAAEKLYADVGGRKYNADLQLPGHSAKKEESAEISTEANEAAADNKAYSVPAHRGGEKNAEKQASAENIRESEESAVSESKSITAGETAELKDKKEYSYKSALSGESRAITCDENGEIKISFEVNEENIVSVRFKDSETGREAGGFKVLAKNNEEYAFSGFDLDKSYDVEVSGETGSSWQIEGSYMVY